MVPMNPLERFFLEIILQAADFTLHARDDVEDPLHDALTATGLGEVTGAGSGLGISNIDIEVTDLHAGLALVRRVLRELKVAPSTVIYLHEGDHSKGTGRVTAYPVYQQP
jgi:hypothetical protein